MFEEVLSVQFTPLLPPAPHAAYPLAYHYSPPPPPRGPHSKTNSQGRAARSAHRAIMEP